MTSNQRFGVLMATLCFVGLTVLKVAPTPANAALPGLAFPGTVIAYAGPIPATDKGQVIEVKPGWLLCNGAAVSDKQYHRLWDAIRAYHGNGTDSPRGPVSGASFNLPDYRGLFLRGVAGGQPDRDPDVADRQMPHWHNTGGKVGNLVGSVQDQAFLHHYHPLQMDSGAVGKGSPGVSVNCTVGSWYEAGRQVQEVGGNETRPKNAYVHWLIKF